MERLQFDFIKIKTQKVDVENVYWEMLNQHPTIRNAYTLDPRSGLHAKNFKLYFDKGGCAVLETSIPYLLYGHNYVSLSGEDLKNTFESLVELLGIDFMNAELLQFEYGGFKTIDTTAKAYIKSVIGLDGYDLKFSNPTMKMYGYKELDFKIYDAVANAKKKKTFTLGKYPKGKLIKYEVKLTNVAKHLKSSMFLKDLFSSDIDQTMQQSLQSHISMIVNKETSLSFETNRVNTFNEVLFVALKQLQNRFEYSIFQEVMSVINFADLTPSQKSKRRKSFIALEEKFKLVQAN